MNFRSALLSLFASLSVAACATETGVNWPIPAAPAGVNPATFAAPRNDWMVRFDANRRAAAAGGVDLLFDGDSITEWWARAGAPVWQKHFGALRAATFGIAGDRTETVLWRLRNGQVDGLQPKLIVLMIGTNNVGRDSAEQIAEGVAVVVAEYRQRCPDSHLLLLGIFPRAEQPDHPWRVKLAEVNRRLVALDVDDRITFVDIGTVFLGPDGTISREIMPDFLHLSEKGYERWAEAIGGYVRTFVPPRVR